LGLGLGAGRGDWLDVSFSRSVWQERDLQDAVAILDGGSSDSSQTVTVSTTSGEDAESLDAETENRLAPLFNTDWLDGRFRVLLATQSGVPVLIQAYSKATGAGATNLPLSGSSADVATNNSQPLTSGWLVLAAPLDGVSSNLPVSPVFVPFLHQVTDYLLQQGRYPASVSAGDSLMLAANTQLLSPAGESVFDFAANSRRRSHLFDQPGTYTVLEPRGSHQIQVGIDAAESDVQVLSTAALEQWQVQYEPGADDSETAGDATDSESSESITGGDKSSGENNAVDGVSSDSSAGVVTQGAENSKKRQVPLWQWLLPLLLILLLIEAITANRVLQRFRASV